MILYAESSAILAWLLGEERGAEVGDTLARAAHHWHRLRMDERTVERARRPFPVEPIQVVDALHLASALLARLAAPGLGLLTPDPRIVENGERLGFDVRPRGPTR